jgi:hypothetical protein
MIFQQHQLIGRVSVLGNVLMGRLGYPHCSLSVPTAPPVHFPTTLHRSTNKTISDQRVKPCWKSRPTLKLWRESGDSEKKHLNIPLEHHQGRQKKLCFQGDLGGRLGR